MTWTRAVAGAWPNTVPAAGPTPRIGRHDRSPPAMQGLLLGFAIAAPVGPIGLLCIQRTLNFGRMTGLVSGLGAATADAVYGFIAAFGLTLISSFLLEQQLWLGIVGGLYLCYLGVRMMLAKPATQAAAAEGTSIIGAYASTFCLDVDQSHDDSFLCGRLCRGRLGNGGDYAGATWLVAGVFLGSALWWTLLSGATALLRTRINAACCAGSMSWPESSLSLLASSPSGACAHELKNLGVSHCPDSRRRHRLGSCTGRGAVLAALQLPLEFVELEAGWDMFEATGSALPAATLTALHRCNGALFGAVSSPSHAWRATAARLSRCARRSISMPICAPSCPRRCRQAGRTSTC